MYPYYRVSRGAGYCREPVIPGSWTERSDPTTFALVRPNFSELVGHRTEELDGQRKPLGARKVQYFRDQSGFSKDDLAAFF